MQLTVGARSFGQRMVLQGGGNMRSEGPENYAEFMRRFCVNFLGGFRVDFGDLAKIFGRLRRLVYICRAHHNFFCRMNHKVPPRTKMWEKLPGTSHHLLAQKCLHVLPQIGQQSHFACFQHFFYHPEIWLKKKSSLIFRIFPPPCTYPLRSGQNALLGPSPTN